MVRKTSAVSHSFSTAARPSGCWTLIATDFLPWLGCSMKKLTASGPPGTSPEAMRPRWGSPPSGRSILRTSAPHSASTAPAAGTKVQAASSTTRIPSIGFIASSSLAYRGAVQLGFSSMNTPTDIAPDVLARELEARGYESLWMGEHSHIPASRRTPYPAGGEMPAPYKSMMDPYLSLLLAARASEHLLVGTGVALPLEHDLLRWPSPCRPSTISRVAGCSSAWGSAGTKRSSPITAR